MISGEGGARHREVADGAGGQGGGGERDGGRLGQAAPRQAGGQNQRGTQEEFAPLVLHLPCSIKMTTNLQPAQISLLHTLDRGRNYCWLTWPCLSRSAPTDLGTLFTRFYL